MHVTTKDVIEWVVCMAAIPVLTAGLRALNRKLGKLVRRLRVWSRKRETIRIVRSAVLNVQTGHHTKLVVSKTGSDMAFWEKLLFGDSIVDWEGYSLSMDVGEEWAKERGLVQIGKPSSGRVHVEAGTEAGKKEDGR